VRDVVCDSGDYLCEVVVPHPNDERPPELSSASARRRERLFEINIVRWIIGACHKSSRFRDNVHIKSDTAKNSAVSELKSSNFSKCTTTDLLCRLTTLQTRFSHS
jgi:hypothetical protein